MITRTEKIYIIILVICLICSIIVMYFRSRDTQKYSTTVSYNTSVNKNILVLDMIGFKSELDKAISTLIHTNGYDDDVGDCDIHHINHTETSKIISPQYWVSLGGYIANRYDDYDAFVVIHNGDTLTYSATALAFMMQNLSKPIVFTDPKESRDMLDSILYASQYKIPEVVVVSDGKVLRASRTTPSGDLYTSTIPPLAIIKNKDIKINHKLVSKWREGDLDFTPLNTKTQVKVVKIYPGMTIDDFAHILKTQRMHGMVVEFFERDMEEIDDKFSKAINALSKNMLIVTVSQALNNKKDHKREHEDNPDTPTIYGKDMTTEAAFVKLYYIFTISKSFTDRDQILQALYTPIVGEVTI